jgi:hypothetical protein
MKTLNYLLKAFGYCNLHDFNTTVFKLFYFPNLKFTIPIIISFGTLSEFTEKYIGINIMCVIAFILLCCAEFQTGIKAALIAKGERIQSRKIGRMILKIGVYIQILFILNSFASYSQFKLIGIEVSPFGWLYFIVLAWIVVQMLISYFENLSVLGYAETQGIKGLILRKFNKWFEFDGTKDADNNFYINNNGRNISQEDQSATPQG